MGTRPNCQSSESIRHTYRGGYLMDEKLEKLFDQYEGNLLNYFCGMTPKQSRKFNKMVKDAKKNRRFK